MLDYKDSTMEIENEPVEIRLSRAKNPDTDPEILRRLSKDRFWFVRDIVASNKNTPEDCLLDLMQDKDFRIRYDAEKTLSFRQQHLESSLVLKIQSASMRAKNISTPEPPKDRCSPYTGKKNFSPEI